MGALRELTRAEEVAAIGRALAALCEATIEHDLRPRRRPEIPVAISAAELQQWGERRKSWSQARLSAEGLLGDPIRISFRRSAKALGRRLDEIGGDQLMSKVLDGVLARAGKHEGRFASFVDHAWDGIGNWHA